MFKIIKMKRILVLSMFFLMTFSLSWGQHREVCGVVDQSSIIERLEENKLALRNNLITRSNDVLFVPLQFHIVTMDDGTGALGEEKILDQLCRLNEDYEVLNMQFYLKNQFNYIPYTKLYEDPGNTFSSYKMTQHKVNNAINIFIVDQIGSNSTGTTLGYYQPNKDWIVVIKDRVNSSTQTLSHEIGHFFSLAHPFYGWEQCPYDINEHGSPLNITHIPCSGGLIELMDGSNCEITADRICDTPPDYNFGLTDPEDNCSLDYEVKDYNGDLIDVMENNFMSYFFSCADYAFTPTQINLMVADYQSTGRNYIRSSYEPDTTLLTGVAPEITAPEYNGTTEFYDHVLLDWTDVPGASRYLVKVTTGFFTKETKYYHVQNESKLILTDLPADEKNVAVVIWPYNQGNSCNTAASQTHKFKTSGTTVNVFDLNDDGNFMLFPSPLSLSEDKLILWSKDARTKVRIEILDIHGRSVLNEIRDLNPGNNILDFPTGLSQQGFYVFHLKTAEKTYSKKILISN
jgi:hypothetical protein